jgi:hypothetical protein
MTSATVTGSGALISHRPSHAGLLQDGSEVPVPAGRSRHGRPDAIIVPATRPASALSGVIDLAAASGATIVALCSGQANRAQVADRIGRAIGARGIVVEVDDDYALPGLRFETSSDVFAKVSGGRTSDLSVKRNVGLLLARMQGWRKIVFVDDDITLSGQDVHRLAYQLESHQIVGMACRDFPDNSVFCHARRLARLPQDVFVTGAVLGVNCDDVLPFFPDIYNEDWFFFAEAAARHRLTKVGEARQKGYLPFADPLRANHEEFGDLLAEGLYALIELWPPPTNRRRLASFFPTILSLATEKYWETFIDVRRRDLDFTRQRLEKFTERKSCSDEVWAAQKSLEVAEARYTDDDSITAGRCVEFLEAWQRDLVRWKTTHQGARKVDKTGDALDRLGLTTWEPVR